MHILQIIPAFYPSRGYGGAPVVVYEISKRLYNRGYKVTIFTTDANDANCRLDSGTKNIDGLEVHYFRNISNHLAYKNKIFLPVSMIKSIKKKINNVDLIHIHDYRTFLNILTYYNAKNYKIPYIIQPHGTIPRIAGKNRLKFIFDRVIGYKMLKESSKLLVLNYSELTRCKPIVNVDRIQIIPNGINLSEYNNLPRNGLFKKKFGISQDEKIILYLGRIHKSKGIELLIRTFAKILNKLNNVRLVIAGPDDGYQFYLNKLSKSLGIFDKVVFTGFLYHKDKLSAYVDADVFVTPTFYGFPLTFLETMACGTPIITTNKGDYIDFINNKVGLVVKYCERELENALLKILLDDELREKFSVNAKNMIRIFDWENIVGKIENVYYEVLEK